MQLFVDRMKKISVFLLFYTLFCGFSFSQTLDTLKGTLPEVEVKTKYNPAIPILKKVIQNRNENSQFANPHFSYTSYQKMFFQGDENHHLFFMETVTKNFYKKPSANYEKVTAHHTSGLKDPLIAIYLAKLMKVNFYEIDILDIMESPYINPVSQNALFIYDYKLIDKIIEETDTLFVIAFQPKQNSHFKSLTGKLWISSDNYAFTKVEVAPFDKKLGMAFHFTQSYEKQPNNTYFLKDMYVKVTLFRKEIILKNSGGVLLYPVIFAEKRVSEIDYETRLRSRNFGFVDIDEELEDDITQQKILETYRPTPLADKEINTLRFIDSISLHIRMDKKWESLKILATGKIPFSILNFDLNQIIFFNSTENVRLGLGIYTNDRLSKVVNFGGFFGYGFLDKKWKWGGELGFNIIRSRDFKLVVNYYSTLMENGGTLFYDREYTLFNGEFYRSWLFKRLYRSEALGITVQSRLTRWLTGYVSSFYSNNTTLFSYSFKTHPFDKAFHSYSFDDYYVKVGARLAFREKYWGADKYYFYSISPFPVLTVQYSKGIKDVWNSDYNYNRIDFKLKYRKYWKILGFTDLSVYAGFVDGSLPAPLLLNQRAGYYPIGLDGAEQFGAMRADEFLSDKYISVFLRHNFGRMTQNKKFSPRIIVCQGIAFGTLKNPEYHNINFKTLEKGYFESGLIISDLLVIKGLVSFGIGVFARYGEHYLTKPQHRPIDNFAFKVNFRVPFER